jgi:putative peptidoglycan lipid II flippase
MSSFFKGNVARASIVLAFFSLLAKFAGLLRDRILASHFGASRVLDIYYSAFNVPDLIFNLFILGAVSSAFIPVFIEHYQRDRDKAWKITQNFLTIATLGVIAVGLIAFTLAEPIARIIAPGFSEVDIARLVPLLRLMLLSPVIFAVSSIMGSVLQSLERFTAYAVAPILYNFGIIAGAVWFVPWAQQYGWSETIGLGLGVILGGLLHLSLQTAAALRAGFRFKIILSVHEEGLRKIFRLMIPRTLGIGAYSLATVAMNAIASTLGTGKIAVFSLANNLQFVPISVVGISVATAVFPQLSSLGSTHDHREFRSKLSRALRRTGILVGLVSLIIIFFRFQFIDILFSAGVFRGTSVETTANVLGIFMLGVVAQSLLPIMSRAYYALQDTKTPAIITIFSVVINIILALWFSYGLDLDVYGLALAFSIAGNLNFILLYFIFRARYF